MLVDILNYCKEDTSIIDNETIFQIEQFLISPKEWSNNHSNKI